MPDTKDGRYETAIADLIHGAQAAVSATESLVALREALKNAAIEAATKFGAKLGEAACAGVREAELRTLYNQFITATGEMLGPLPILDAAAIVQECAEMIDATVRAAVLQASVLLAREPAGRA
jgi:hypothetical protein